MAQEWDEMIKQRIQQGWADEEIAETMPFSVDHIKFIRLKQAIHNNGGCEHDYKVLEDNIQVEEIKYFDNAKATEIEISGYVVFHCRKCLDIQKKVF